MKQHSTRFLNLVTHAKQQIKEINAQQLKKMMDTHQVMSIIDVREKKELDQGKIPGAIHLSKGVIERDIEKNIPDAHQTIVVYCSGGFRCALVAQSLQNMGYDQVVSLDKGMSAWVEAGYPIE